MVSANDNNHKSISGKAAHAWPAMTKVLSDDEHELAATLLRFARLYETANKDPDAIPSAAGMYESDGELSIAESVDEVAPDDDDQPGNPGYSVDFCMRNDVEIDQLVEAGSFGSYTRITAKGKKGSERTPNFRIRHIWRNQGADGEITETFYSVGEYRAGGRWRQVRTERFTEPHGPDRDDDDSLTWCHTVHPSGNSGSSNQTCAAEERLSARQELEALRREIGNEAFDVLSMAASCCTARQVGEARGKTHKRASALGTALIREALQAANDNWPLAEVG